MNSLVMDIGPRFGLALALLGALLAVSPGAANAALLDDVVEACYASPAGSLPAAEARGCRNVEQVVNGLGEACRAAADPETCENVDGRLISPALVDSYETSWTPRALALQRGIDDSVPLVNELWVHTHNSYNAEAYMATLSGLDPNHVYSITDQLRMGIRAIEIDLHWAPSLEGMPEDGFMAPIVCHGRTEAGIPIHIGCTLEVHVRTRLEEVSAWLDRPENAGEVLLVYLENQLDDNPTAHLRASEAIASTLGDLVYRPSGSGCQSLPFDVRRAKIRAEGKRVLLAGNCGPGAWTSWVFERGPRWKESSSPEGADYPDYPACIAAEREPNDYDNNWIRTWEDYTWLSAMVDGGRKAAEIVPEEARRMVRCGLDMIGFDQLVPYDPRLDAVVWSWAVDEPSSAGSCAYLGADGRFHSGDCGALRPFVCVSGATWSVAGPAGPWTDGKARCDAAGGFFSMPKTGYDNELVKAAAGGVEVWLDYQVVGGAWTPEAAV